MARRKTLPILKTDLHSCGTGAKPLSGRMTSMSEKPRLIYGASVRRKRYFVRFLRALFLTVVVAGAYIALDEASRRALADPLLLNIGQLVAVVLAGMLAVRALYNLVMALVRRSETVRIYDK